MESVSSGSGVSCDHSVDLRHCQSNFSNFGVGNDRIQRPIGIPNLREEIDSACDSGTRHAGGPSQRGVWLGCLSTLGRTSRMKAIMASTGQQFSFYLILKRNPFPSTPYFGRRIWTVFL